MATNNQLRIERQVLLFELDRESGPGSDRKASAERSALSQDATARIDDVHHPAASLIGAAFLAGEIP